VATRAGPVNALITHSGGTAQDSHLLPSHTPRAQSHAGVRLAKDEALEMD